jgi:hypothetical protein
VLAPAHRETLEALAAFAADAEEAARLRHLASPDGKAEYATWVAAPSRSVLEVMQAFPSARPSLGAPRRAQVPSTGGVSASTWHWYTDTVGALYDGHAAGVGSRSESSVCCCEALTPPDT